jgi:hypothetical protein
MSKAWNVLEEIPNDSAAALVLLEHQWAIPLREAIARAGGFRINDGLISPLDLVEIGLLSAEEAAELNARETAGSAARAPTLEVADVCMSEDGSPHVEARGAPTLASVGARPREKRPSKRR